MPIFLPVETPTQPIFPDPQKPPGANAPKLNLSRPKGIKPGTTFSPTRIKPPLNAPAAPAGAAGAGIVARGAGAIGSGAGLGTLGGALLLAIPQVLLLEEPAAAPELLYQPDPVFVEAPNIPFNGGQGQGIPYTVYWQDAHPDFSNRPIQAVGVFGAVVGAIAIHRNPSPNYYEYNLVIRAKDAQGLPKDYIVAGGAGGISNTKWTISIIRVDRSNGQPDTFGNPPATNTPILSQPTNPLIAQPQPASKAPEPAPEPAPLPTAAPAPAPTSELQPQLIGQPQPFSLEQYQPLPFADPTPKLGLNLAPAPLVEPTPLPPFLPLLAPLPEPKLGDPTILITPGGNPGPLVFAPNPLTGAPTPQPAPTPTTPRTPDPEPTPLENINKILTPLGIAVAGITALVQPNAIKNASREATCEAFAPGGCNADINKNSADAAANSANNAAALSGLIAFLQALQATFLQPILAGVNLINTKLGPVMAGADGIGGFLSRLSKSLGVDRALNLIAIAANLHNAMMLSANLKITLLEMLSSVGNATGLLQTSENENVDLNQVFNQGIETFMVTIMGAENYAGLKVNLRKYNAIYRAATNSLNATASMFNSIGDALETAAEYTGKIGNALRAASVVRENAYNFMSERITVKTSKFMTFQSKVGDVTQVLETINEIAENVIEGQEQYTEAVKATADFRKALADADRPEAIDNKLIKAEAEKIKANLVTDPTGEDETGLLSFLTDR